MSIPYRARKELTTMFSDDPYEAVGEGEGPTKGFVAFLALIVVVIGTVFAYYFWGIA